MTISEQIREAALYARDSFADMPYPAFLVCCDYREYPKLMSNLSDTDCRTFMLLVAEALE